MLDRIWQAMPCIPAYTESEGNACGRTPDLEGVANNHDNQRFVHRPANLRLWPAEQLCNSGEYPAECMALDGNAAFNRLRPLR
jgi:hypothetical protein